MLIFLGIGAQKCGTTWLYDTLAKHPRISFPAGKEVHYWDRPDSLSLEAYSNFFSDLSLINGEITPAYGFLPVERIKMIYENFPELRLIYIIRNPIDRAWSSAKMALKRAEMLHEEASDQWFIDHFKSNGSISRGDYEACISNWLIVYPLSQLLVVKYDDIVSDPVKVANDCLKHLGLNDFFTSVDKDELSKKVFEGDELALRPSLHSTLLEMYKKKILSLSNYLGKDLTGWL